MDHASMVRRRGVVTSPFEALIGDMPGSTSAMSGGGSGGEGGGDINSTTLNPRGCEALRRNPFLSSINSSSSSTSSPPSSSSLSSALLSNARRSVGGGDRGTLRDLRSSPSPPKVLAQASSSSFSSSFSSTSSLCSVNSSTPGAPLGSRSSADLSVDSPPTTLDNHKHLCHNNNNNNIAVGTGGKNVNNNNNNNNNSSSNNNNTEDSNKLDTLKPKAAPLVPLSPPIQRNTVVAASVAPLEPNKLSKLRQSHLANRRREQQLRTRSPTSSKLPDLSEHSELDSSAPDDDGLDKHTEDDDDENEAEGAAPSVAMTTPALRRMPPPQISVTNEDDDGSAVPVPAASEEPVTPSLPDSFLRKLGLASGRLNKLSEDSSVDALSEKEVEGKFVTLSLAFKTDKLTVDQRVAVQERSRDLAEQNVDKELSGLRSAAEALTELLPDSQVRDVVQRIQQHIDILEQSAARVSSRAEVYGAVQQERRMCKAMEVMVMHTENLRRIREREEAELTEARKILSERTGHGLDGDFGSSPSRRSMSVCAYNAGGRALRRRSEVALPRVLGGVGSPSMTQTSSLENLFPLLESPKPISHTKSKSQDEDEEEEDAKARFQSAVASTSMQHAVTATMRRVSGERRRSVVSLSSDSSCSPGSPTLLTPPDFGSSSSTTGNSERLKGVKEEPEPARKISNDEEAFRKGFEHGLKTQLSQELEDLRDQQSTISQDLESVMDRVEQASQDSDGQLIDCSTPVGKAMTSLFQLRETVLHYDWRANKNLVKSLAGVLLIFLAIAVMFLSPPRSKVDVHN